MAEKKPAESTTAKGEVEQAQPDAASSSKATRKKIIILAGAGVLALLLAIGGTVFMFSRVLNHDDSELAELEQATTGVDKQTSGTNAEGKNEHSAANDNQNTDKKGDEKKSDVIYVDIKPAFLVNFQDPGHQHFLQVEVSLMTHDNKVEDQLKVHMPLIRNALVMLYSTQDYQQLMAAEGKQALRQQTRDAIQKILTKETGKPGIEDVFFTSFVMQ